MYKWPDGWREALISDMGAQQTPFLMRVLQAWNDSTPIQPYTNNPLGMPWTPGVTPQLLNSGYGLFPTTVDFRRRFVTFIQSGAGDKLRDALLTGEDLGPVWRAIHALNWPAGTTETDYPAKVLDLMTETVRESLQSTDPASRRTAGTVAYVSAQNGGLDIATSAVKRAASAALGAANALGSYRRG